MAKLSKKAVKQKQPETVTFRYNISPNYAIYRIDGAHGGMGGHGNIIANLFAERHSVPEMVTHNVKDDGSLEDPPVETIKDSVLIREVPFGISLTPRTARALAVWLNKMVDEFEKATAKQKERVKSDELL